MSHNNNDEFMLNYNLHIEDVKNLKCGMEELRTMNSEMKLKIDNFEEYKEANNSKWKDFKKNFDKLEEKNVILFKKNLDLEEKCEELEKEITEVRTRVTIAEEDIVQTKRKYDAVNKKMQEMDNRYILSIKRIEDEMKNRENIEKSSSIDETKLNSLLERRFGEISKEFENKSNEIKIKLSEVEENNKKIELYHTALLNRLKEENDEGKNKLNEVEENNKKIELDHTALLNQMKKENDEVKNKLNELEENNKKIELDHTALLNQMKGENDEVKNKLREVEENNKKIELDHTALLNRLKEENDEMKRQITDIKQNSDRIEIGSAELKKKIEDNFKRVEEMKLSIDNFKLIKYKTFIWKIKNVLDKNEESILSKAFYICDYGHKFQLQLFPNGQTEQYRGFISIYANVSFSHYC